MDKAPKSMRLHIGIFGRRNVGKSSLINAILNQNISIVSEVAGTTTDAVEKSMEMLPLGPVTLIDTAGIDDVGDLGEQRVKKSEQIIERTDVALIVCDFNGWSDYEKNLAKTFNDKKIPIIAVINKNDISEISEEKLDEIKAETTYQISLSAKNDNDITAKIKEGLIRIAPEDFINPPAILENLVEPDDTVILVTPIDKEAPKGRLILPQVNVLRELLDNCCVAVVVTEHNLKQAIESLKNLPKLVITDSQAFKIVSEITPKSVPLTSFSILFARLKGDLKTFLEGVRAIENLNDGDKVLICESCSHHAIDDDIGRVKIPALIRKKTGKSLTFEHVASHDMIKNIGDYSMIIHCGGCMTNRREILSRIAKAKSANVPITNYGITISYCLGILDRAIEPLLK